jgi:hypothetical protein
MISGFPDKQLIFHAKDLPLFHYFQFPLLASFKIYFWVKIFPQNSKFKSEKFTPDLVPREWMATGKKIWSIYATIYSTEIISHEILTITLRQIQFALECGLIDKKEALNLCDDCIALANHFREQAELGLKKTFGSDEPGGRFELYPNEILIGDNTIFFKMGDKRVTFITHNNFNILTTSQETFCRLTENHLINMMNKSTLISTTSAKERSRFFNELLIRVEQIRKNF